jgi:uncharacterized membrane protein YkvA (DUF1232 family)
MVAHSNSSNLTKLSGQCLPTSTSEEVQPEPAAAPNWKRRAQGLRQEAYVFYFVLKHPRTRWYAKLVAACTAAYLFSPIQLIPSFIPVIGILDDLLVVFVGVKLLQRITPADVLTECRGLANAAEVRKKEQMRSAAALVAFVAIATVWLLVALFTSALIAAYIRH